MPLTARDKSRREQAFELWKQGKSGTRICRLMNVSGCTWETWESFFVINDKPYHEKLQSRKCNLCGKEFEPYNKFERYCGKCKSIAAREDETDYKLLLI